MNAPKRRKRGRPPITISSSGTTKTLRDLGITRQQASDWKAIASLPKDVFEAELARKDRKPSSRALANLARGLPENHRRGSRFAEALHAALGLSAEDRRALVRVIAP